MLLVGVVDELLWVIDNDAFTRSISLFFRNGSMTYMNGCSSSQATNSRVLTIYLVGYRDRGVVA